MSEWGRASGRKAPFPPDWRRRRRLVFDRDDHRCVDCGWCDPTDRTLECDHLGAPDDHRLHQLATRCTPCHARKTSAAGNAARTRERRTPEPHPGIRP